MNNKFENKLEESYEHIKPYLNDPEECKELHRNCMRCESYCGISDHDYSECKDKDCFRFFLAYEYLKWSSSYEGY